MHLVREQSRQVPRQALSKEIPATVAVGGQQYEGVLRDYSLKGFGLSVDPGALKRAKRDGWNVEVSIAQGKYAGVVRHSRLEKHRALLGVHIPKNEKKVVFNDEDPGWDLIEDEKTIDTILKDLVIKGPEVVIELKQPSGAVKVFAKKLINENQVELEIFEEVRGTLASGAAKATFEIFQTCHSFSALIDETGKSSVFIKTPKKVARLLRRETVRVPNWIGKQAELRVAIESRVLGLLDEEIKLFDFSENGFSVLDPSGKFLLPVDFVFERVQVTIPHVGKVSGRAELKASKWVAEYEAWCVGFSFFPDTEEDANKWHDLVLHTRYPHLSFSYQSEDHEEIWNLFDRSKYLDLKPRESFKHIYDITVETWDKMSSAGITFSRRLLLRNQSKIVGHLQLDRIYPKTWCVHALAIDPGQAKTVGRDIYSVTADVLSSESADYVISITETDLKWNQRNYYEFIKNYRWPEHNHMQTYQIHEAETSVGWNLRKSSKFDVSWTNRWDLKRVLRFFEVHLPKIERDALGLDAENLELEPLNEALKGHGLSRGRRFLVAKRGNQLLGICLLETGTTGISIFGIQDTIYLFCPQDVQKNEDLRREVHESLLFEALNWYRSKNIPTINIYFEDLDREYWTNLGLKFIWEGARWIARCAVSRRYHAYTQMMFGHLILRRGSRVKHR